VSQQLICDDCGEPIDQTQPYYTLSGTKVKLATDDSGASTGGLIALETAVSLDYHEAHLPPYKIQGENINPQP
jgi:hypothetical protein